MAECIHDYIFGNQRPEYMSAIYENMHTSADAKVQYASYLNHEYITDKFRGYKIPDLSKGNTLV